MIFREALDLDLKNIVDIYNQAVVLGGSNADIEVQRRAAAVGNDVVASIHAGVGVVDGNRGVQLINVA